MVAKQVPILDTIDWAIIEALQADGRRSFRELAREVHLSAAAVTARVHQLEASGVIAGYRAEIDLARVNQQIEAFVRVTTTSTTSRSIGAIEGLTVERYGVLSVHHVLGDCDLMLHVAFADLAELDSFVNELGLYGQTTTMIVSSTPVRAARHTRPPGLGTVDDDVAP